MRAAIRAATGTQALATFTEITREWMAKIRPEGLTKALDERDIKSRDLGSRRDIALTVDWQLAAGAACSLVLSPVR